MDEFLSKALKLKISSERGDEEIRAFAKKKYNQYLIDHDLSDIEVFDFQKKNEKPNQRFIEINLDGEKFTFNNMQDFTAWYNLRTFTEKLFIAPQIFKQSRK